MSASLLHHRLRRYLVHRLVILSLLICPSLPKDQTSAKSRQKRILWVTEDGRLALPPGTTLVISPSLSLPFVRYPPDGFFSNLTISLPFTIDFNKLGLTDNENPFGVLPPILARSMGRAAGGMLADYIGSVLNHRRGKRSSKETGAAPPPPKQHEHAFHGGERALLFVAVEEFLENFGMDGKACLLRAICEVHAYPMAKFGLFGEMLKLFLSGERALLLIAVEEFLENFGMDGKACRLRAICEVHPDQMAKFGLFGEMLNLFLSASKSQYADMLSEYVEAENAGKGELGGPGECWPYMKDCSKSLFSSKHNKYSEDLEEFNEIQDEEYGSEKERIVTYNPKIKNM